MQTIAAEVIEQNLGVVVTPAPIRKLTCGVGDHLGVKPRFELAAVVRLGGIPTFARPQRRGRLVGCDRHVDRRSVVMTLALQQCVRRAWSCYAVDYSSPRNWLSKFFDVRARDPGRSTCTQEGPGYRRGLLYFQLLLPVCLALGVCAGCDAPKKYLYLTFRGAPAVFFRPDISPSMSDKAMSARLFSPPNRDDPALWKMSGRDRNSLPRGVGQHSRIFRGVGCISCNTVLQLPYNRKYSFPVQRSK